MNLTGQTPVDDSGGGGSSSGGLASLLSSASSSSTTTTTTPAMPLTSLIKRSLSAYRDDNNDDDQSASMGGGGGGGGGFGLMTTSTLASIDNNKLIATTTTSSNVINHEDTSQQLEQSFGDWWNDYWSRQPFPSGYTQSSITLLACFITTLIFFIVVGNLLVCIAIFTEKSLKPTQNWFIASLALSDMLYGLTVMPFSLARELMGFWIFGPLWCEIHEALDVLLATASINTLCLISLDRYWSITQAVNYLKKRTPRRSALMIAFVWIFSAAVSLPPLFGWKKQTPSSSSSSSSSNSANELISTTKPDNIQSNTSTRHTDPPPQVDEAANEEERFAGGGQDTPTGIPSDGQLDESLRARRQTSDRPAGASATSTEIPPPPLATSLNSSSSSSSSSQSTPDTSITAASSFRPDDHHHDNLISSQDHSIHRPHRRDQQQQPKQKHSINRQQQREREREREQQQQQPSKTTKYAISAQSSPSPLFYLNNDNHVAYYGDDDRSAASLPTNNYQPVNGGGLVQSLFMQSEQVLGAAGQQQLINAPPVIEYPQCQLSDDVGYVVYSALGSFFIPCGVMVFTYIKIFMAARSRARRAINKQSRAQAAADKANRRLAAASAAAQQRRTLTGGGQLDLGAKPGSPGAAAAAGCQLRANLDSSHPTLGGDKHEMMKGRLVVVERRRSTITPTPGFKAASAAAAAAAAANKADTCQVASEQEQPGAIGEPFTITTSGAKHASPGVLNGTVTSNDSSMITVMSASMAELPVTRFNFKQQHQMIQDEMPAQQLGRESSAADGGGNNKAASLLRAISQVEATTTTTTTDDDYLQHEFMGEVSSQPDNQTKPDHQAKVAVGGDKQSSETGLPEIVVDERRSATSGAGQSVAELNSQQETVEAAAGTNSTNETCFMTIEEDSDNLEAQTGRTIMMIACNAKQSNQLVGAKSQGMMMKMMPPPPQSSAATSNTATGGTNASNTILCNNVACLRQRPAGAPGTARSGSSHCGSSMTINDDDDDEDEDEEEEEEDDDEDLLTDDCNGYSGSCGLDQYCPATTTSSSCAQCRECAAAEQELSLKQRQHQHLSQSVGSSPRSINDKQQHHHSNQQHHHHKHRQTNPNADETCDGAQSLTADDNLSLTEYRSDEDDDEDDDDEDEEIDDDQNSSIVGHGILDATERVHSSDKARRKSQGAPVTPTAPATGHDQQPPTPVPANNLARKKSFIGQRLARLGSSVPPLSNQSGGLLALAASQHQQTAAAMAPAGGLSTTANITTTSTTTTTRNLKALRQNFFHKLNQLTAKSAAKQNKIRSPIRGAPGKSSSGSSYEPSLDYATTSNVHSMIENYHQETTFGETDEFEQQTSDETTKDQPSGDQQDQQLIKTGPASNKTSQEPNRSTGNKRGSGKAGHGRDCNGDNDNDNDLDGGDGADEHERGYDERCASGKRHSKGKKDSHGHLSMVDGQMGAKNIGHLRSGENISSLSTTPGSNGGNKALRLDLGGTLKGDRERHHNNNNNNHHHHQHHHQPPSARIGPSGQLVNAGSGKKSSGSGAKALNNKMMDRSLTVMTVGSEGTTCSDRTAGGRLGGHGGGGGEQSLGQSQTNGNSRAYLASDNERHKRKLAKARERRATLILGLIMAAFICSWLPFFTFYVLRALCHVCRDYISPRFEAFIFWLGYCNSAINPIIYTIFNRDFRKAFRKILFKCL